MHSTPEEMQDLPDDIEGLRVLLLAAMAERDTAVSERDALQEQNDRLYHLLQKLRRMQFGAKSERLPEEQLQLGLEAIEQAIAQGEAEAEKRDPELKRDRATRRRASRGAFPSHLPQIEVALAPENTNCPCCQAAMIEIGADISKRLDCIPVQYRVIVTRRPKFACRSCPGTVVQMPAPPRLIGGGLPAEALVAQVAVARFADHQPLYRQAQGMARQGVLVDRSTLACWMGFAAAKVAPVVARLRELLLASPRIFADETVVPALDPGRGRTKQGYFWAKPAKVPPAQRVECQRRGSGVMTGHGPAANRPRWSTATHRAGPTSTPPDCSVATAGSCSATAMPHTRPWPEPGPMTGLSRWPFAGVTPSERNRGLADGGIPGSGVGSRNGMTCWISR